MTVAEFVAAAVERLAGVSASPSLDAQMLASHALRVERSYILAHPDAELPELAMEHLLQRRESGEPLAYILGWREFFGRRFEVRPGVLIPRQETETVVESCLGLTGVQSVLDVGTGSGIIAVTIALERPGWKVFACDISNDALQIARDNASALGAVVDFRQSDLFAAFEGMAFDLIVSNPPYIGLDENLPNEVRGFEPPEALYSGESGNEMYRRLAAEAPLCLAPDGRLVLELGYRSMPQAADILRACGWSIESVTKDLSGVERCLVAKLSLE